MGVDRSWDRSSLWPDTALVITAHCSTVQSVAPNRDTRRMASAVNEPDASVVTLRRPTELHEWSSVELPRHCITKSWVFGRYPDPDTTTNAAAGSSPVEGETTRTGSAPAGDVESINAATIETTRLPTAALIVGARTAHRKSRPAVRRPETWMW